MVWRRSVWTSRCGESQYSKYVRDDKHDLLRILCAYATLVVVLLSTEPDPATRYFSLRERQARALAARLLLPTLHEIVRGAEPEPLQQVESLLAALALQGPNGRALAISMLHHLVEHQGAMAAGPLSRARGQRPQTRVATPGPSCDHPALAGRGGGSRAGSRDLTLRVPL